MMKLLAAAATVAALTVPASQAFAKDPIACDWLRDAADSHRQAVATLKAEGRDPWFMQALLMGTLQNALVACSTEVYYAEFDELRTALVELKKKAATCD
jgi:hypothetical protein